jgi:hypothetical protein
LAIVLLKDYHHAKGKIRNQIDQVWEIFWTGVAATSINVID